MKESDENMTELELKTFWYKSHKKVFVQKWIWLYLSQFLTIFDEPKTQLKVVNMVTRVCGTHDRLTDCNRLNRFLNGFKIFLKLSNWQLEYPQIQATTTEK